MWKRTKKGEAESAAEQSSLFDAAPVKEEAEQRGAPMKIEEEVWRAAEMEECGAGPLHEWRCGEHLGINVTPEQIKITKYPAPSTPFFLIWLRVLFAALATARYRAEALAADERHMAASYIKADDSARAAWKRVEAAEARALEAERGHLTATLRAEVERKRAEQAEAAAAEARALVLEMEMDAEQHRAMAALSAQATMEREAKIADLTRRLEIAESAVATAAEVEVERAVASHKEALDRSWAEVEALKHEATINTLDAARDALHLGLERGESSTCPCCSQTVAAYRRYLHAGQVLWLLDLVKAWRAAGGTPETWIHKSEIAAVGNDYGFLAYFKPAGREEGLARSAPRELGSAFTGRWQPTEAGLAWLRGEVKAPSHAMVFNRRVLSSAAEGVTVEEALGERFDYSAVMPAFDAAKRA